MGRLHDRFETILPPADELWEKTGATMQSVEVEPGHHETVPFYDLEITAEKEISSELFETRHGRKLGREVLWQLDVNGVDHLARAFVPYDHLRQDDDYTITSGTAWMTTIDGYAYDRSAKLFADNVTPMLQVGAPHSGQQFSFPLEALRVPKTFRESRVQSLARAAQTEQLIFSSLSEKYDLPHGQLAIGDSRDAMTTLGQYPYTEQHGAHILAFDNKGRSAPNKVELKDLPQFALWGGMTVIGGMAVGLCLAKAGQVNSLRGTLSFNPNAAASTFTGTLRSLSSGEAGRMIDWVPKDAHGIDVLYGLDSMSDHETWQELWAEHSNVHLKVVPGGTHAALLHPLAHAGRRKRVRAFDEEYRAKSGRPGVMDWSKIYGLKTPDESPLSESA